MPYGFATPGSGGFEPALSGTGTLKVGSQAALSVIHGLGGAPAALLFSEEPGHFVADGALVLVKQPLVLPLLLAGPPGQWGAGSVTLPFTVPNDASLVGLMFFTQALVADAGAASGSLAASAGLKVTFQP